MNKQSVFAVFAAVACTAALAQAPAATLTKPPSEVNPVASGGAAAASAQNKVDNRASQSSATPPSQTGGYGNSKPSAEMNPSASGGKAAETAEMRVDTRLMDSNKDGMVSRAEWDAYHTNMWSSMKPKNAGVSTADIDKLNRTPKTN